MLLARLALVISLAVAGAGADDAADAKAAVEAVRIALMRGDASGAVALTFDNGDASIRAETLRQAAMMAQEYADGQSGMTVLEAATDGDAGMVLIDEDLKKGQPSTDIDPVPVIRRDGRWIALGDVKPKDPKLGLDPETLAAFARLKTWAKTREPLVEEERRALRQAPAAP